MAVSAPPQTRAPGVLDQVPDGVQFIGGEWVKAKGGEMIAVINPATGELLRNVPRGAAADVAEAVDAAAKAFPTWRDLSATQRGNPIRTWGDVCNVHAE